MLFAEKHWNVWVLCLVNSPRWQISQLHIEQLRNELVYLCELVYRLLTQCFSTNDVVIKDLHYGHLAPLSMSCIDCLASALISQSVQLAHTFGATVHLESWRAFRTGLYQGGREGRRGREEGREERRGREERNWREGGKGASATKTIGYLSTNVSKQPIRG